MISTDNTVDRFMEYEDTFVYFYSMKDLKLNISRISTEKEKTECAEIMAGSEP